MRVLHVIPALGPVYGGPSKVVPELAQALTEHGVHAEILTTNANGRGALAVPKGSPVEEGQVRTYYFARHWVKRFTCSLPLASWLMRHIDRYDVIHISALFSFPTLAACWIARRAKRPYILWPHGMLAPWALAHKALRKRVYLDLIELSALKQAAALHALTGNEAAQFEVLKLTTPRFVLPSGVNTETFRTLPPRDALVSRFPQLRDRTLVLFLGRVHPVKGLDLLVRAFGRIKRNGSFARTPMLLIAGPDPVGYGTKLKRLVRDEGIKDDVVLTGMLSGSDKSRVLSAADIFVLPSRSEGLPIAALEALAAGCAVIATEACNLAEIQEAGAGLTTRVCVDDLERALSTLLKEPELARHMGDRARELARDRFSWGAIGEEMARIYRDILDNTRISTAWSPLSEAP